MSGNEDRLLGEVIYDNQDGGEPFGDWELFNQVHGDRVPGAFGDRELLQCSIREMPGDFGSCTGGARLAVVPDEQAESRPGVVAEDEFLGPILSIMTCGRMVMA